MEQAITISTPQAVDAVEIRMNSAVFPRLHRIPTTVAVEEIAKAIQKASFLHGNKMTKDAALAIATALHVQLMTCPDAVNAGTPFITTAEIASIIEHEVLTNRELKTINVAVLFQAVLDWSLNEGAAIQEQARQRYREQNPNPFQHLCEAWGQKMIKTNQ